MNVQRTMVGVIWMLRVLTYQGASDAYVTRDLEAMAMSVQVRLSF